MPKAARRLIFNADDFGHSEAENQVIEATILRGPVRSVTVLGNFPYAVRIRNLKNLVPDLGVGVHLNLTEGRPVLSPEWVTTLVSSRGHFYPKRLFILRTLTGRICPYQAEEELKAQIMKVRKLVGQISHVDSHQNMHILPGIMKGVVRACRSMDIAKIRSQKEVFMDGSRGSILRKVECSGKEGLRRWRQRLIERFGLVAPAPLLAVIPGYGKPVIAWREGFEWWKHALPRLLPGNYEICLHPGLSPAQVALLTSRDFSHLLKKFQCQSINYDDLDSPTGDRPGGARTE